MGFLRCFSTLGCPEQSLEGAAAIAASHRLDGIEVRSLSGTVELARVFAAHFADPAALALRARAGGIRVLALDASLRLVGPTAAERDQLLALAPWAEALGVRRIRVFDGGAASAEYPVNEARDTLRWWQGQRERHGWNVDVMVETHDALVTTAAIQRFLSAAPEVSLLWDAHHTWRKGSEDPGVTWRALRERVVHVHVKDSIDVPSARHPFTYVLPGEGEFPIGRVLAALRDDRFAGPVSLEWERMWHPYLPSLDQALVAARNWWA